MGREAIFKLASTIPLMDMKRSQAFEAALAILLICLAVLLYYMVSSSSQSQSGWEKQAGGSVDFMLVGGDDTLYAFSDNGVSAFSKEGDLRWRLDSPAEWKILNDWDVPVYSTNDGGGGRILDSYPVAEESNGNLYLFALYALNWTDIDIAKNSSENSIGTDFYYSSPVVPYISKPAKVMQISPDGKVVWEYAFPVNLSTWNMGGLVKPEYSSMFKPIAISVHGDRVYVFHDYTVDVLDTGGRRLFSLNNVSAPAAVDDGGRIYLVHAVHPSREQFNQSWTGISSKDNSIRVGWDSMMIAHDPTYMLTTGTIEAYSPDGGLLWSLDVGANATRPFIEKEAWPYNTLPLYSAGRLYVTIEGGIVAVDPDGRINGTAHVGDGAYTLFPLMPLDSHGNVYMVKLDPVQRQSYIYTISPNGDVSRTRDLYAEHAYYDSALPGLIPAGGNDGIVYAYESTAGTINEGGFNGILDTKRFNSDTIYAYDLVNGRVIWNFTIPGRDVKTATLTIDSARKILGAPIIYPQSDDTRVILTPSAAGRMRTYPGQNMTYLDYHYYIYESPVVQNRSRCIYARGIYAIDNDGKLLWKKDVDGFVDNVAVGNSTIYYSLDNGRIGGTALGIAAGTVVAAFTYVLLRFFAVGTVARARSRLDKNENRNGVLKYIADNPGSTLRDIARGTGVNLGTVRYHVLILGLNHRIVSYAADDKHVRYFTNSGAYSREEQFVISLARREGVRMILALLNERPGLTNLELSSALGLQESATSRYMKELCDKGIASKSEVTPGRYAYSLTGGASKTMEKLYWAVNGEGKAPPSSLDDAKAYRVP